MTRQISIGERGTRGLATYVQLFVAIASANDVRVDAAQPHIRGSATLLGMMLRCPTKR
ncbi:hypothetical protein ABZX23_24160 [Nocardia beijingensis]